MPSTPSIVDGIEKAMRYAFQAYGLIVAQEFERATGGSLSELKRASRKSKIRPKITVFSDVPVWRVIVEPTDTASEERSYKAKVDAPNLRSVWPNLRSDLWVRLQKRVAKGTTGRVDAMTELTSEVIHAAFREMPRHTRYLPAARSGLMQFSYRGAAGSIIRAMPGRQDPVAGVIGDFLSAMVELHGDSTGRFAVIAEAIEREILSGAVNVSFDEPGAADISYQSAAGSFPLTRTSSMVAELAPIVVYLRYIMQQGDLLIIEEPEAHLHPSAQVSFAKNAVRLVNSGLSVGITTHSEFLLRKLNNAIVAGSIDENDAVAAGFDKSLRLNHHSVSAYLFCPTDDGTQVQPLKVTPHEGISEEDFDRVAERLLEESVALDNVSD